MCVHERAQTGSTLGDLKYPPCYAIYCTLKLTLATTTGTVLNASGSSSVAATRDRDDNGNIESFLHPSNAAERLRLARAVGLQLWEQLFFLMKTLLFQHNSFLAQELQHHQEPPISRQDPEMLAAHCPIPYQLNEGGRARAHCTTGGYCTGEGEMTNQPLPTARFTSGAQNRAYPAGMGQHGPQALLGSMQRGPSSVGDAFC